MIYSFVRRSAFVIVFRFVRVFVCVVVFVGFIGNCVCVMVVLNVFVDGILMFLFLFFVSFVCVMCLYVML